MTDEPTPQNVAYQLSIDDVRAKALEIGNHEGVFNVYSVAVNLFNEFSSHGLTPVILFDPGSQGIAVTSEEHLYDRMH